MYKIYLQTEKGKVKFYEGDNPLEKGVKTTLLGKDEKFQIEYNGEIITVKQVEIALDNVYGKKVREVTLVKI